jgi:hypothetical protein
MKKELEKYIEKKLCFFSFFQFWAIIFIKLLFIIIFFCETAIASSLFYFFIYLFIYLNSVRPLRLRETWSDTVPRPMFIYHSIY